MAGNSVAETKILYYFDEEDTPYSVKLPLPASAVTLGDFKARLGLPPRPKLKFFFKSSDDGECLRVTRQSPV